MAEKNLSSKFSNIISIVIAFVLLVYALFNISDSKLSFILILTGAVVISPISKRILKTFDKTKQRIVRITIPIITVLIGTILSANSYSNKEKIFI